MPLFHHHLKTLDAGILPEKHPQTGSNNEPAPLDITSDITLDITFLYQILLSKFPHRHHIFQCDVDVMSDVMSKGAGSLLNKIGHF